jgi:4-hydroxy-tetrahydrodipicolinate reductase
MNIGIIGYGKMGKSIEKLALSRDHTITGIIDANNVNDLNSDFAKKVDVAIEFSAPAVGKNNVLKCIELGIPVVSGTTGCDFDEQELEDLAKKYNTSIFIASNFSIGVNIFREVNKKLAFLLKDYDEYKASMEETHHVHKLDRPSGTAITLAKDLISENNRYVNWKLKPDADVQELEIDSLRLGETIGNHKIKWESDIDSITIEHSAKNRLGFTIGAVLAAEFVNGKIGLYTMKDLLNL